MISSSPTDSRLLALIAYPPAILLATGEATLLDTYTGTELGRLLVHTTYVGIDACAFVLSSLYDVVGELLYELIG
jgi:hypothetical protein